MPKLNSILSVLIFGFYQHGPPEWPGTVKVLLRAAAEQTVDGRRERIGNLIDRCNPHELNYPAAVYDAA
jgi:hypothetical protein